MNIAMSATNPQLISSVNGIKKAMSKPMVINRLINSLFILAISSIPIVIQALKYPKALADLPEGIIRLENVFMF